MKENKLRRRPRYIQTRGGELSSCPLLKTRTQTITMTTEKITGNEPAFPTDNAGTFGGMTLRQYYAGQAMPILVKHYIELNSPSPFYEAAKDAIIAADNLIFALNNTPVKE